MKHKRIMLVFAAILILTFSLVGCSSSKQSTSDKGAPGSNQSSTNTPGDTGTTPNESTKIKKGSTVSINTEMYVASNDKTIQTMIKYMADTDKNGLNKMIKAKELFLIPKGASMIITSDDGILYGIEVIDGDYKGTKGVVPVEVLQEYS